MSRFRIDHPTRKDIYAEAGVDHALGYFAEVFREGRDEPLKSLDFFKVGTPVTLNACFDFLIAQGFFSRKDLESALVHLQDGTRVPAKLVRVVEVVREFKRAAD